MFNLRSWPRRLAPALILLSFGVALADPAGPVAPAPAAVAVTWDDIVRAAEKSPILSTGTANLAAARAGQRAAGIAPNPSLSASADTGDPKDGSASGTEWSLEVSVPVGWLAARRPAVQAAQAGVAAAEADAEALRREALGRLRELFWQVVIAERRVTALEELDRETASLTRAVTRRVEKGEDRPVEQVRVEIEAERLAGELDSARLGLSASREQLRAWLNLPPGAEVTAVADVEVLPATFDRETARARAVADPRVAAARARVAQAMAERDTVRLGRLPEVEVAPFVDDELDQQRTGVGVTAPLPLWDWNTAKVSQADARLSAARSELAAAELAAETDVVAAQAGCEAAVGEAARYRDRILPRAESAAATIERAYELGESDLLEAVDARRTLLATQTGYLDALSRAHTECGRLYAAMGEESP